MYAEPMQSPETESRQEFEARWCCPPPAEMDRQLRDFAAATFRKVVSLDNGRDTMLDTAGRELRATILALLDASAPPAPDNDFWASKCRSVLLRPAVEPVVCSYWSKLTSFDFDEPAALRLASALAGFPLVYRRGVAVGRSATGDIGFEPLPVASTWIRKLREAWARPELTLALPMFAFAQAIMAHPFSDGNGRLARTLVHGALGRACGISGPVVALAPSFYRRANTLRTALTALSQSGDWSQFGATFLEVLSEAVTLTLLTKERTSAR